MGESDPVPVIPDPSDLPKGVGIIRRGWWQTPDTDPDGFVIWKPTKLHLIVWYQWGAITLCGIELQVDDFEIEHSSRDRCGRCSKTVVGQWLLEAWK